MLTKPNIMRLRLRLRPKGSRPRSRPNLSNLASEAETRRCMDYIVDVNTYN